MISKSLKEKIAKYSAISSALLIYSNESSAQIVYNDINPDDVLTGSNNYYSLDLDNNLVNDALLSTFTGTSNGTFSSGPYYGQIYVGYINGAMARGENGAELVWEQFTSIDIAALSSGSVINNTANFYNPASVLTPLGVRVLKVAQSTSFSSMSYQGNWHGQTDKYLGIKFLIGSNTHYGWVRMDVTSDCDSIIIKDFAYNSTPNQGILAGQTVLSIEENENIADAYFYHNSLFITQKTALELTVQVFSLDGKIVYSSLVNSKKETINLSNLSNGVYLVVVENENGRMTKKISK